MIVDNFNQFYLGSQSVKGDRQVVQDKDPKHAIRKSSLERDTRPKVKVSLAVT